LQTAARLDFIGLPRLRMCGGSVFLCWKENWRAAVVCVGVDCGGEVGLGARLWIVSARVGLGARLGLARDVDCVDEVGFGARLDCGGEVRLGARL